MQYSPRESDPVFDTLEPVIHGLGMSLVDLSVFRHGPSKKSSQSREPSKKSPSRNRGAGDDRPKTLSRVQIRAVVYKAGIVGLDDCSKVHHAILPRLELTFPGEELYVEVSSPGIDRLIKDGSEFYHYIGRGIRCYRSDTLDWIGGVLQSANPEGFILKTQEGTVALTYSMIGKAKLDYSQEV